MTTTKTRRPRRTPLEKAQGAAKEAAERYERKRDQFARAKAEYDRLLAEVAAAKFERDLTASHPLLNEIEVQDVDTIIEAATAKQDALVNEIVEENPTPKTENASSSSDDPEDLDRQEDGPTTEEIVEQLDDSEVDPYEGLNEFLPRAEEVEGVDSETVAFLDASAQIGDLDEDDETEDDKEEVEAETIISEPRVDSKGNAVFNASEYIAMLTDEPSDED